MLSVEYTSEMGGRDWKTLFISFWAFMLKRKNLLLLLVVLSCLKINKIQPTQSIWKKVTESILNQGAARRVRISRAQTMKNRHISKSLYLLSSRYDSGLRSCLISACFMSWKYIFLLLIFNFEWTRLRIYHRCQSNRLLSPTSYFDGNHLRSVLSLQIHIFLCLILPLA